MILPFVICEQLSDLGMTYMTIKNKEKTIYYFFSEEHFTQGQFILCNESYQK